MSHRLSSSLPLPKEADALASGSLLAAYQSGATAPSPSLPQTVRQLPAPTQRVTVTQRVLPSLSASRPDPNQVSPLSQAFYDFGRSRLLEGRYLYAGFAFEEALRNRSGSLSAEVLIAAGLVASYEGAQDRASEFYGRVIAADPNSISCYIVPPELANTAWQPEDYLQTGNDCLPLLTN